MRSAKPGNHLKDTTDELKTVNGYGHTELLESVDGGRTEL